MMLELIAVALKDPEQILPYPSCPSGVMTKDNPIYRYAYPYTENPVVRIPYTLCDNANNCLPEGFYEVALSADKNFLYLIQSRKVLASVPVAGIEEHQVSLPKIDTQEQVKKKKKKDKKDKRNPPPDTTELRQQAKLKATITPSPEGYFILDYQTEHINAKGFIKY